MQGLGLLLLAGFTGCSTVGGSGVVRAFGHASPLPPVLAAWVVAAGSRAEFAGGDPRPEHRGVPVLRREDGVFTVAVAQGPEGRCWLLGNARILPGEGPDLTDVALARTVACRFLPAATPPRCRDVLFVEIRPLADGGSELRGWGAEPWAHHLLPHLTAALGELELAHARGTVTGDGDDPMLCCTAHRDVRVATLAHRARRLADQGDPEGAVAAWNSARTLAPDLAVLDRQAGTLLARLGRDEAAMAALRAAGRAACPQTRAALTSEVADLRARLGTAAGDSLRQHIVGSITARQWDAASALLRRVRAVAPDPPLDLALAARIHRSTGTALDLMGDLLMLQLYGGSSADLTAVLAANDAPSLAMREFARSGTNRWQPSAVAMLTALTQELGTELCDRIALGVGNNDLGLLAAPAGETAAPLHRRAAGLRTQPPAELRRR